MKGAGCSPPSGVSGHQQQSWLDPCFFQDERMPGYWYLNFSKGHHLPALSYSGHSGHRAAVPFHTSEWLLWKTSSTEELQASCIQSSFPKILVPTCWNILSTSAAGHILQEWDRYPCAQVFPASVQAQAHQDVWSNTSPLCPAENSSPSTRDGSQTKPLAEAVIILGSIPALAFHPEPKAQLFQH